MAATAWKLYAKAKEYLGDGTIQLGTNAFKMALYASGNASTITLSTYASVSAEIGTSGGYASGGKFLVPSAGTWTLSGSTVTFSYSTIGLTFSLSMRTDGIVLTPCVEFQNSPWPTLYRICLTSISALYC